MSSGETKDAETSRVTENTNQNNCEPGSVVEDGETVMSQGPVADSAPGKIILTSAPVKMDSPLEETAAPSQTTDQPFSSSDKLQDKEESNDKDSSAVSPMTEADTDKPKHDLGVSGEDGAPSLPLNISDTTKQEEETAMVAMTTAAGQDDVLKVALPPTENDDNSTVKTDVNVKLPPFDESEKGKGEDVDLTNDEASTSVSPSTDPDTSKPGSESLNAESTDSSQPEEKVQTDTADNATEANTTSVPAAPQTDGAASQSDGVYHVKWINYKKKEVPIVTQNENGPCPLLALMNVLLLQNRVKLSSGTELITVSQLMAHLGECVLENVPSDEGVAESARLNFEQNMQDAMAVMYKLQTGLDVNVRFTGVRDFEYTTECIIFDLLQISLYHGWLVDPQNTQEVDAVSKCSYNQLVEKIISQKTSDKPDLVSQALVAEQFLDSSASQITYHGLCELCSTVKEDELCVLFRNNHFTTLYKHKNELFQLVTDQGFLTEGKVVWETLSNVEGDSHFVDSEFHTYTKAGPLTEPVIPATHGVNTHEQIDQDYLVALSLQQEQQIGIPQEQMAWGQMDAQQQPPQISDLELARSLQEEERRAAEAEAEAQGQQPQQRAAPQGAMARGGNPQGQRRQRRDSREREEKKSDVVGIPLLSCVYDRAHTILYNTMTA